MVLQEVSELVLIIRLFIRATIELLPEDVNLEIFEIDGIPPFNQDIEKDMPTKVREFKSKIREADAILIATPEYNYSDTWDIKKRN